MNEFFQSKFMQDLKDGKLPQVEVAISRQGLIELSATLIFTAVVIILIGKIVKSV